MRTALPLALVAAIACGGGDTDAGDEAAIPAGESGAIDENPGLPTESSDFRATAWADDPDAARVAGQLWVSGSVGEEEGISLVAQLEGLPTDRAYAWALHRGTCADADDVALTLGYGSVADATGRGDEVENAGGPVGEGEAPLVFNPQQDGTAEETVFVPLGAELTRAGLESEPYSLRLHPDVDGDEPGRSIACARIPPLPTSGEEDGSTTP